MKYISERRFQKNKMYEEVRATGLEYKADREAYYKVPRAYAGYRIKPYSMRMPAPDRYIRRVPVETRERAVKKFSYEKWIYGTLRASRYGLR
jgi:hypothetical protein